MQTDEIEKLFINPTPKIGYGLFAIRKSLMAAVSDLKEKIAGNVTDLGCGIMPYQEFLKSNGKIKTYTGIDLKNSNYHNQVIPDLYWDGITIPLPDNSQDWVIVTEFLEHYFDTQQVLKEINRVLKPGGSIFFTFPCVYMLHEVPFDYHRFTPFAIEKHLNETDFSHIKIYPLGGFNYSLVIMMSIWNKRSGERGLPRLFSKLFLFLFHKKLLQKSDVTLSDTQASSPFKNFNMPSGLWGYAQKQG